MEPVSAADEVVDICRDLLRIDTTNTGDPRTTVGERVAAEYVAEKLSDAGIEVELHESAPRRANSPHIWIACSSSPDPKIKMVMPPPCQAN